MVLRHPYRFVRFPSTLDRVEKHEWAGHERLLPGHISGVIECRLRTLTPLCEKQLFSDLKSRGRTPYLPGSTLKGLVRTTAQMLGAGCGGMQYSKPEHGDVTLPPHLAGCKSESACLVCRVFGYSVEKTEFGWAGKARFRDSDEVNAWTDQSWETMGIDGVITPSRPPARWQDPGPRHRPFYFEPGTDKPLGWKVYRHAKYVVKPDPEFGSDACVPAGREFRFQVEVENLTEEEAAVFSLALTLKHECPVHKGKNSVGLSHKLGYGKSIGMGSCDIEIVEFRPISASRLLGAENDARTLPACGVTKYIDSPSFRDMERTLDWNKRADVLVFPKYGWFKDPAKFGKTISDYEADLNAEKLVILEPKTTKKEEIAAPSASATVGIPKEVRFRVIRVPNNKIEGETVEAYNGRKYKVLYINAGYPKPKTGQEMSARWERVDHEKGELKGGVAW